MLLGDMIPASCESVWSIKEMAFTFGFGVVESFTCASVPFASAADSSSC